MSNIEAAPGLSNEYESKPFLGYDEYRTLCEESQPDVARKTCLPTPEDYEAAQANSRTIYVELGDRRVPLFTPLESVGGYNPEASQRMTESEDIFVLSLPFEVINEQEIDISSQLARLDGNAAVIVETSSNRTAEMQAKVAEINPEGGVYEFLDPRLKGERQKANVSFYVAYMEARDDEGNLIPLRRDRTLLEAYNQEHETTGGGPVKLIEAQDLREDRKLRDDLWHLHEDRFDWLGKYHPVSMQETEAYFNYILSNDHTHSFASFEENEENKKVPNIQGIIMDDGLSQVGWATDSFKEQMRAKLDPENDRIQFYYGIAGKSSEDKMAHLSEAVIAQYARLLKQNGGRTLVMFESTNMSSGYIPRMIGAYSAAEPNGVKLSQDIVKLATLDYWYLKPQAQSQESSHDDLDLAA